MDIDLINNALERLAVLEANAGVQNQDNAALQGRPIQTATRLKQSLMDKFDRFQLPWMSVTAYHQYALEMVKEKLEAARTRTIRARLAGEQVETGDEEFWRGQKSAKFVQKNQEALYGFNFQSMTFNMVRPLAFQDEVQLKSFTRYIEFFGDSNTLSMPGSLTGLLRAAEERGFTMTNLGTLLHQFLLKYKPELESSSHRLYKEEDTRGLFALLCESINAEDERNKIHAARAQLTREVHQSLATVIAKLKSLATQELILSNVNMQPETLEKKSSILAQFQLSKFVTPEIWTKYTSWTFYRQARGLDTDLTTGLRKLTELETQFPHLQPKSALRLGTGNLDGSSIQINFVNQRRNRSRDFRRRQSSGGRFPRRDSRGRNFSRRRFPPSRSQSRSPFNRSRSQSTANSSRRNSWGGFDNYRRTSSRSASPYQKNQSSVRKSQSPVNFIKSSNKFSSDRKSPSSGGNFQSGRTFSREVSQSPKSFRKPVHPRDVGRCLRCFSAGHEGSACPRYRYPSKETCSKCLKYRNIKLYHQTRFCRFNESDYRSPSAETRKRRDSYFAKQTENATE